MAYLGKSVKEIETEKALKARYGATMTRANVVYEGVLGKNYATIARYLQGCTRYEIPTAKGKSIKYRTADVAKVFARYRKEAYE